MKIYEKKKIIIWFKLIAAYIINNLLTLLQK